jgi:hypothetical protein
VLACSKEDGFLEFVKNSETVGVLIIYLGNYEKREH